MLDISATETVAALKRKTTRRKDERSSRAGAVHSIDQASRALDPRARCSRTRSTST
jgi:hypothetical protein